MYMAVNRALAVRSQYLAPLQLPYNCLPLLDRDPQFTSLGNSEFQGK